MAVEGSRHPLPGQRPPSDVRCHAPMLLDEVLDAPHGQTRFAQFVDAALPVHQSPGSHDELASRGRVVNAHLADQTGDLGLRIGTDLGQTTYGGDDGHLHRWLRVGTATGSSATLPRRLRGTIRRRWPCRPSRCTWRARRVRSVARVHRRPVGRHSGPAGPAPHLRRLSISRSYPCRCPKGRDYSLLPGARV